jgi:KaiC/GvpD/RAD55 family RecA-like ATPase
MTAPVGMRPDATQADIEIVQWMEKQGEIIQKEKGDPVNPLMVYDFNWILENEPPPRSWIIPDLIANKGLTVLLGGSKIGKSWLSLQMAYAVAAGTYALGKIKVEQKNVLYVDLEETWELVHDRAMSLQLQKLGGEGRLSICTSYPSNNAKALQSYLYQNSETKFVIIDTMQKFLRIENLNDYAEVVNKLSPVKELADAYGVSILMLHHTRKGNGADNWTDDGLGSQAIVGTADNIIKLGRKRGEGRGEINITGRSCLEKNYIATFDKNCGSWTLDGDKQEILEGDTQQLIYDWLKENEANGPKAIHKGLVEEGYTGTLSTIKNTVSRMANMGKLNRNSGVYLISCVKNTIDPIDPIDRPEESIVQRSIESIRSIPLSVDKTNTEEDLETSKEEDLGLF